MREPEALGAADWQALGTQVWLLVTDPGQLAEARRLLEADLDAVDRACSRFRPDSELMRLGAAAGPAGPASASPAGESPPGATPAEPAAG
jgi:FAD:protein FMN transferase